MAVEPALQRARNRASYRKHRVARLAAVDAYKASHQEERRAYLVRYRASSRGKATKIAHSARSKALRLGIVPNDLTALEVERLLKMARYLCAYCGKPDTKIGIDHVTPFAVGGANTLSNVVVCCFLCNSKKGTGPPLRPVQPLLFVADVKTKLA